jgi:hypothetical protein
MGVLINHSKLTSVIPVQNAKGCKAKDITTILPSGSWASKRCLLIGGGPSLEHFDYTIIEKEPIIGINKAFVKFPVTINYGMDARFYDELTYADGRDPKQLILHQQWLNFKGIKSFLRRDEKFNFDCSIYTVKSLPNKAISYDLSMGIWSGNNSGFGALMLAIALGCNRIGMLGYDMKIDESQGKTHWHDGYPHQNTESLVRKLKKFRQDFEEFADAINKEGIIVANLYQESALDCFRKISLKEFMQI